MEKTSFAAQRAKPIRLVALDVDGVLTDGGIYVGAEGELYKPFHARDGLGISLLHKAGLKTAIITGRQSKIVAYRAAELHISGIWQGIASKATAYAEMKQRFNLRDEEIAYIGDDLIDLPIMVRAGLPMAVADAMPEAREHAIVISSFAGGHGAVRELIEFILKAQGKWDGLVAEYLRAGDALAQ